MAGDVPGGVRCLMVGAMIGQQSVLLADNLSAIGSVLDHVEIGELMREAWLHGVREHRDALATLVTDAVRCGLPPGGEVVQAWDEADRRLRKVLDAPSDEAVHAAYVGSTELVRATQHAAEALGVDPPLLRNIRRVHSNLAERRDVTRG